MVVHGIDDPLVPVEGGRDTAAVIPGAELREIPGMGHDLPAPLFRAVVDAVETRRPQGARQRLISACTPGRHFAGRAMPTAARNSR